MCWNTLTFLVCTVWFTTAWSIAGILVCWMSRCHGWCLNHKLISLQLSEISVCYINTQQILQDWIKSPWWKILKVSGKAPLWQLRNLLFLNCQFKVALASSSFKGFQWKLLWGLFSKRLFKLSCAMCIMFNLITPSHVAPFLCAHFWVVFFFTFATLFSLSDLSFFT